MAPSNIIAGMQKAAAAYDNGDVGARKTLLGLNRELLAELETPTDFLQRLIFADASLAACLEIATDTGIFDHLRDAKDGISTAALAGKTGIETHLLGRFMRHFCAHRVVRFSKSTGWHATELSNTLSTENYKHSIWFCEQKAAGSFQQFAAHFKQSGYKVPGNNNGPFQYAHKSNLPFFHYLVANPPFVDYFASFMSVYRAGNLEWWIFYPIAERLANGFDRSISDTFLVDVGGGRGHDIGGFAASSHCPSSLGRLVLQDQPEVIATVPKTDAYEAQSHDFFLPQPIKAARAYFLHSVLHDWGDDASVKILESLKPALKAGYSRVLLNEIVLSEEQPQVPATSMDMMMLAHIGDSYERTETEWRGIISRAGLEVLAIFSCPASPESIIELGISSA